ncbi:MAG: hypothetical protein EYC67_08135 [Betaproteobacteria bacterium]|nr:MAG: hypothetical protein EYC67_08135 [Betaproteobacteria bacterium]
MATPAGAVAHAIALVIALGAAACAHAAPAPWHVWRSKLDGHEICRQTTAGPGWERARGPFRDSRCLRPQDYDRRQFNWQEKRVDESQRTIKLPSKTPSEE